MPRCLVKAGVNLDHGGGAKMDQLGGEVAQRMSFLRNQINAVGALNEN